MKKTTSDIFTILHLSDLHIAPFEIFEVGGASFLETFLANKIYPFFLERHRSDTAHWPKSNLQRILSALKSKSIPKIDHIVITGDCVTCGLEEEFKNVSDMLLQLQEVVFGSNENNLDPNYFSVVPGNHDVTEDVWRQMISLIKTPKALFFSKKTKMKDFYKEMNKGTHKKGYIRFQKYFSKLYPNYDFNNIKREVYCKKLDKLSINIIHLASSTFIPVHHIGLNALGYVSKEQIDSLSRIDLKGFNILLMHHPPLPIDNISMEDEFMELVDSQYFLCSLLANRKINLILCGHKHSFYIWDNAKLSCTAPEPYRRYNIPVLMSGASTKGNETTPLLLPIYVIEMANIDDVSYKNSNIKVSLLTLYADGKSTITDVTTLNISELGSVFDCFRRIKVNEEGPSLMTAENNALVIIHPQNEDHFTIPFDQPDTNQIEWKFNMTAGPQSLNNYAYVDINIGAFDMSGKKLANIENKRITQKDNTFTYCFNASCGGFIKISFSKVNADIIRVKHINEPRVSC